MLYLYINKCTLLEVNTAATRNKVCLMQIPNNQSAPIKLSFKVRIIAKYISKVDYVIYSIIVKINVLLLHTKEKKFLHLKKSPSIQQQG